MTIAISPAPLNLLLGASFSFHATQPGARKLKREKTYWIFSLQLDYYKWSGHTSLDAQTTTIDNIGILLHVQLVNFCPFICFLQNCTMSSSFASAKCSQEKRSYSPSTTGSELSSEERYGRLRARNNVHVKRSRERKRIEEAEMKRTFRENEKRIQNLESIISRLSEELANPSKFCQKMNSSSSRAVHSSTEDDNSFAGHPF